MGFAPDKPKGKGREESWEPERSQKINLPERTLTKGKA
jgi:hypothetical protein